MLWSLGFFGVGFACTTPFATEIAFGSFPIVMALIGGAHQDYRNRRSGKLSPDFDAKTSNVPFAALLQRPASLVKLRDEMAWGNASIAVTVSTILALRRGKLPPLKSPSGA